jgi:L-threonylcarbamoyladenylate synthase
MDVKPVNWDEAAERLLQDQVGVIPTDTVYGVVGRANNPRVVARIYNLRKRDHDKPLITLVGDIADLKQFQIEIDQRTHNLFKKKWPGPVSIIVEVPSQEYAYIHRGTRSIAFRVMQKPELAELVRRVGPIVAPSANLEGSPVARTVAEAHSYFGDDVFYVDGGSVEGSASAVIDTRYGELKVLRLAPGFDPNKL